MDRRAVVLGAGAIALMCGAAAQTSGAQEAIAPAAVMDIDHIPQRGEGGDYRSYALFVSTDPTQNIDVSPDLTNALNRFGRAVARVGGANLAAFVGDPAAGRLDAAQGRRLLDRVNSDFGVSLTYEEGPFLVLMRHHPSERPAQNEEVVVVQFSNATPDRIARDLGVLGNLVILQQTQQSRWSWSTFFNRIKQTWENNAPVQVQTARAREQPAQP